MKRKIEQRNFLEPAKIRKIYRIVDNRENSFSNIAGEQHYSMGREIIKGIGCVDIGSDNGILNPKVRKRERK